MSMLSRIIRLNTLRNVFYTISRYASTQTDLKPPEIRLTNINPWIWQQKQNFRLPEIKQQNVTLPSGMIWIPLINERENPIIGDPLDNNTDNMKQAARLIIIRRKKMKKHKLRKLRKRLKFERAKLRQRRELRKEKIFQAELMAKCKEAEAFSAEDYVDARIGKLNEVILPKTWKGRRLPEFIIRQKLGLPPKELDTKN